MRRARGGANEFLGIADSGIAVADIARDRGQRSEDVNIRRMLVARLFQNLERVLCLARRIQGDGLNIGVACIVWRENDGLLQGRQGVGHVVLSCMELAQGVIGGCVTGLLRARRRDADRLDIVLQQRRRNRQPLIGWERRQRPQRRGTDQGVGILKECGAEDSVGFASLTDCFGDGSP